MCWTEPLQKQKGEGEGGYEMPMNMFLATNEQSQVVKLKPPLGVSPT